MPAIVLTLSTAARNAMVDSLTALIDASATPGKIVIGTTGMALTLVTCVFSADSFDAGGTAGAGIATSNAITDGTVAADGTAGEAKITNGDNASVISALTVGISASNINLTSLGLTTGDKVHFNNGSMTITQPAQ